jgi:hypothetical protein
MQLDKFLAGIQLLQPHYKDPAGYHIAAEHDQFYMYATDTPLSKAEIERMCELGWFQPDCEFEKPEDYNPSEGWSAFT